MTIAELSKIYSIETVDLTKNTYTVADNYTLDDKDFFGHTMKHMVKHLA